MSRDWQISLLGAVIFHLVALFGFQVTLSHPARVPSKSTLEITLVAAPAPVITAPVIRPEPPVVPPPPNPLPPPEIKPLVPVPVEKIISPVVAPSQSVVSQPAPPPKIIKVGDGSSPKPGLDATTQKAEVGVKAEPNYLKNPEPPYPAAARRRHQEGLVLISVRVTAQGRAEKVAVTQSSGYPLLDEAALNAVRDWEFVPARIGAIPLASEIEVPVRFKLAD